MTDEWRTLCVDKFKGMKALRKTIELVLQKLNMYQDKMNEISREELLEIMANENLDLSWIASQESVDELKTLTLSCIDQVDALRKSLDPWYGFEIGTYDDLREWSYELDETNKIANLTRYNGTKEHVVMYDAYENTSGDVYRTKFANSSYENLLGYSTRRNIKSFRFCNRILITKGSANAHSDQVVHFSSAFKDTFNLESVDFGTAFREVYINNATSMFENSGIKTVDFSNMMFLWADAKYAFRNACNLTDVIFPYHANMNYADEMFAGTEESPMHLKNITGKLNFSTFNSSMKYMFRNCVDLQHIDISGWNFDGVKSMEGMFYGCSSLCDVNFVNSTVDSVTNLKNAFANCTSIVNMDLSSWNTRYVSNLYEIFSGCSSLTELNLTNWNTTNATTMQSMFEGCSSIKELDLTSFETPKVTSVARMFKNCTNLQVVKISSKWSTTGADKTDWFAGAGCTGVTRV